MEQYSNNFIENGFENFNFLFGHGITDEELKEIGILLMGHRKRILFSLKQQ